MNEPKARYAICTITTSDHKEVSRAMEARNLTGCTHNDLYFRGVEAVLAEYIAKGVNNE